MANQESKLITDVIRIGLAVLLAYWCFKIAQPFLNTIVWAGIIAIGVYPLFVKLKEGTGLSNGWSATLMTLLMLVILITPTVILSGALVDNVQEISQHIKDDDLNIPPPGEKVAEWPLIGERVSAVWQQASEDPKGALGQYGEQLKAAGKWLLKTAAQMGLSILGFVFSIIIAGLFLASAQGAKRAVTTIFTRLVGERGEAMTKLSQATVRSVVNGILGIAFIQTVLAGLGFIVMDVPAAGVLAFVCLILAIVQIDILLVLIPLSIYAFSTAGTGAAIAFLIWNIAVGLLNNILKPILLAKGVDAPMAIIFIGAIGGMLLSGIIGLFVGAVIMVLGYTLFKAWLQEADEAG